MHRLFLACEHLVGKADAGIYIKRFTGVGRAYDLLCMKCAALADVASAPMLQVSPEQFAGLDDDAGWEGIIGRPEILRRSTDLCFTHGLVNISGLSGERLADLQPIGGVPGEHWMALTRSGRLIAIDFSLGEAAVAIDLPPSKVDLDEELALHLSQDGQLAAVVNVHGRHGLVLDLRDGSTRLPLARDNYHCNITAFPVAFASAGGRAIVVHGTAWNRLDISDPATGELLTARGPTSYRQGETRPAHYLDYFHGRLSVSPNERHIVSNGWVWHPDGAIDAWDLKRWLGENVWESEDGPSKVRLCWRGYFWDGPLCWTDDRTVAVWGYGNDDDWLIPAVRLFDVRCGKETFWFAGPEAISRKTSDCLLDPSSSMVFDDYLFAISKEHGTGVWDIATGECLLQDSDTRPDRYHPVAKRFVTALGGSTFRLSRLSHG